MTDSEKLDLLLTKIDKLAAEQADTKKKVENLAVEQADMKKKIEKLALELTKTQSDLYKIDRKIDNTYGVALDALAATAENRRWLETGTGSLIQQTGEKLFSPVCFTECKYFIYSFLLFLQSTLFCPSILFVFLLSDYQKYHRNQYS